MKRILTAFILASSFAGFCQNYQPFNETSSKRFFSTNDPTDNHYFFHAKSSSLSGDSLVLHQYFGIKNTGTPGATPSGCTFWGGTTGDELDNTWLGIDLVWDQVTQELHLKNELNENLTFNFGITLGTSQAFYTNSTNIYSIELNSVNSETFFGVTDNVKTFIVSVTDLGGTSVSSPLNNFEIKLSENYGLISFIDSYHLPTIEIGLELQGHTNPLLGIYQLTYDECYPWNTNDILQYQTYNTYGSGSSPNTSYQTITVTDRIETADSVKLYFSSVVQSSGSSSSTPPYLMNSSPIFFKKGTPISEIPWNTDQDSNYMLVRGSESEVDFCGPKANFSRYQEYTQFCDSCGCYGSLDGFGQEVSGSEYALGLGKFRKSYTNYGPLWQVPHGNAQLIYSNINGVECGTLWNNIDEIDAFELNLFPNPTNDLVTINSEFQIEEITIRDFSGRVILELLNINQKETTLSLADLHNGAYIVEVKANNSAQKKTIFKH